jgi:hypothetical protein
MYTSRNMFYSNFITWMYSDAQILPSFSTKLFLFHECQTGTYVSGNLMNNSFGSLY